MIVMTTEITLYLRFHSYNYSIFCYLISGYTYRRYISRDSPSVRLLPLIVPEGSIRLVTWWLLNCCVVRMTRRGHAQTELVIHVER